MLDETATFDALPAGFWSPLPDASRSDPDALAREIRILGESPLVSALLRAVDGALLVLDPRRQIVAYSAATARLAAVSEPIGRRPGEALGCVNAQSAAGCGTAPGCHTCGALGAILASRRTGRATEAECLLRSVARGGSSLELAVRAVPLTLEDVTFTVMSLRDLSDEKRREALEQVFLHDVLNTVQGLRGWATRLRQPGCDVGRVGEKIDGLTRQIDREIRDHRDLALAERGALTVNLAPLLVAELFRNLEATFASQVLAAGRTLACEAPPGLSVVTDAALALRVLVNMVKNALEATPEGGAVAARARADGAGGAWLEVHNAGAIPEDVRHRVFVRSFTTKGGRGRGLGTYGMKLVGERYLGAEVGFTSTPEAGTTFWIHLPARALA